MYISKYTDYTFRCLIYLALNENKLCTVEELSNELKISKNHLKKIIHNLAKANFIKSTKGRCGGIKLSKPKEKINLYDVILFCGELVNIINCSDNICTLEKDCKLKKIITSATNQFENEFKKFYLNDLI